MPKDSFPEEPVFGVQDDLVLPDGIREITNEYQSLIHQSLGAARIEPEYISVFHVEPRATSFLAGFRVGVGTGEELYIYVEPESLRKGAVTMDNLANSSKPLSMWQYPFDPKLGSLASLVDPESLAIIFSRLGLPFVPSRAELLTYRPGRRAMVKCNHESQSAFAKSLRVGRAEVVVRSTRLAKESGVPTPRALGWSSDGFVIFEALDGVEFAKLSRTKINGGEVIRIAFEALSKINRVKTEVPSRTPIIHNYSWYFARAIQAHPSEEYQLRKLERIVSGSRHKTVDRSEKTTIHGDFHLGQVFGATADHSSVSGVIDLDDMGLGFISDDVAAIWSNCAASSRFTSNVRELEFWGECISELERSRSHPPREGGRLHCSVAVHLVAQTLSTRGLNPKVAHNLIKDAAMHLE